MEPQGTVIGGTTAGTANILSGNTSYGIAISAAGTNGSIIEGNYIGTDKAGTKAIGNGYSGVGLFLGPQNTIVGGTTSAARNIISGNTSAGVTISDTGTTGNLIEGNFIGVDRSGVKALPNGDSGVSIFGGATSNTIGGLTAGTGNIIAGNVNTGVEIGQANTNGNTIEGDYIGVAADGKTALGHKYYGVLVYGGGSHNVIGVVATGLKNKIANNATNVAVSDSSIGNSIRGNSISNSLYGGINFYVNGANPGPNDGQTYPTVTKATLIGGKLTITGTLVSNGNSNYVVDFYGNAAPGPSGYGEGAIYLTSAAVKTDRSGNGTFTQSITKLPSGPASAWAYISATATRVSKTDTSTFSPNVMVTTVP